MSSHSGSAPDREGPHQKHGFLVFKDENSLILLGIAAFVLWCIQTALSILLASEQFKLYSVFEKIKSIVLIAAFILSIAVCIKWAYSLMRRERSANYLNVTEIWLYGLTLTLVVSIFLIIITFPLLHANIRQVDIPHYVSCVSRMLRILFPVTPILATGILCKRPLFKILALVGLLLAFGTVLVPDVIASTDPFSFFYRMVYIVTDLYHSASILLVGYCLKKARDNVDG